MTPRNKVNGAASCCIREKRNLGKQKGPAGCCPPYMWALGHHNLLPCVRGKNALATGEQLICNAGMRAETSISLQSFIRIVWLFWGVAKTFASLSTPWHIDIHSSPKNRGYNLSISAAEWIVRDAEPPNAQRVHVHFLILGLVQAFWFQYTQSRYDKDCDY